MIWNANSIKFKLGELIQFISDKNYDIIGISETKTDGKYTLKIPGYKVYTCHRNNRGGGVALAVKTNIVHTPIYISLNGSLEHVEIQIKAKNSNIIFCQVYLPPNKKLEISALQELFKVNNTIIMGDLNCKRREWKCINNNVNGGILLDFCIKNNVNISTPMSPTNFPTIGNPSIIDMFLIKSNLNRSLPKSVSALSSDHNPVEIFFECNYDMKIVHHVFDYSKADWTRFRNIINDKIDLNFHISSREDVEVKTNYFIHMINEVANSTIPLKFINFNLKKPPAWLRSLIKFKNKLRKKKQKNPTFINIKIYKTIEKFYKILNKKFILKNNENFIRNLKINDGTIWKFSKKLTKRIKDIPTVTNNDNIDLCTDKEKADGFAKFFASVTDSNRDLSTVGFKKHVHSKVNKFLRQNINKDEIKFVTYRELTLNIKNLQNNKAAGYDKISSKLLKNLPRKAIVFLIKLVNGIFCTGHFPNAWKIAKVLPLPKINKDHTKMCNYRPISLLPHISKLVERIIKNRIISFLHVHNVLVNEQFGFREGHSTIDQLARIVNIITENFNNKKHTGALLLDIEKAFDTMWHEGFIYKLIKYNFPVYLILLLYSYLKNRSIFVCLNDITSIYCNLSAGVPQGSVLGPILYIIFTNDAPMMKEVGTSIFADDKMFFVSSYRISAIVKKLQTALDKNKRYFHRWKIKLNETKTESIIFTKRRPLINSNIKINNHVIPWSDNVKYLGLYLDTKLNFTEHVKKVIEKAIGKLIMLYPIFNRRSFFNSHSKKTIYKVAVRTAFTYACPVWSLTSKTNYDKLQRIQNKFLRLIGSYRFYTPIKFMHNQLNIEPITEFIERHAISYFAKTKNHCNPLVRQITYDNRTFKHRRIMHIIYKN